MTALSSMPPTLAEVEAQLVARWPETRIEPSLERIALLTALLDHPERSFRSVHLTGTNGKTSTARVVEALLAASGERTGRLTSPHLTTIRERICLGEQPIGVSDFVDAHVAVAAQAAYVEAALAHSVSFFEMTVAMAYRAFARDGVDVAVVEVGMGGRWDATNVIDAEVAVVLPVDLDHTDLLGSTVVEIAQEKAGIIKAGAVAVSARQHDDVAAVLRDRAGAVGARLVELGRDFAVLDRRPVEGGQLVSVRGLHGTYRDVLLTLHGRHQADNAACALVAAEAVLGRRLDDAAVHAALGRVTSPGRLELRPGPPQVVLDAAHNPHGAGALVAALEELPTTRTYGVVAAMADKDVEGVLRALEPVVEAVVCSPNSSPRSLSAADLAVVARRVLGPGRVHLARDVATALTVARTLASSAPGGGRVLVTGSVVTVGDADRALPSGGRAIPPYTPDRPVVQTLPG